MAKRENSVYSGIAKEIELKIQSREYKKGTLLPPERALKEMYGVERTTIRRALDILSEKGIITKKAGLGNVVGSDENENQEKNTGIQNSVSKSGLILCIGSFSPDSCAFLPVIEAFEAVCKSEGYTFTRVNALDTVTLEKLVKSNDCFGAVITEKVGSEVCDILIRHDITYIYAFTTEISKKCVIPDSDGALYALIDELYSKGHRKFAYIGSNDLHTVYKKQADTKGIDTDSDYCVITSGSETNAYNAFLSLYRRLSGRFTCVVTSDLQTALGVLDAAKEKGVKVPEQLSVVCVSYDKNTEITSAVFNKDVMANEIFNALEKRRLKRTNVTCITSVGFEVSGVTTATVPGSRRSSMSDFLL